VIRTNPGERGFDYVSGVKRQAGQERTTHNARRHHSSLRRLEATAEADTAAIAEREELVSVARRNGIVAGGGRDVSFNAGIRAVFRSDRERKKRTEREAKRLGWREGMFLLDDDDDDDIEREDVLRSKETCYGNAAWSERKKLQRVKRSSIFANNTRKKHTKRRTTKTTTTTTPVLPDSVPSARKTNPAHEPIQTKRDAESEPTTETKPPHQSNNSNKKQRRCYSLATNPSEIMKGRTIARTMDTPTAERPGANYSSGKNKNKTIGNSNNAAQQQQQQQKQKHNAMASFLELVAAYGSSDDDGGHE